MREIYLSTAEQLAQIAAQIQTCTLCKLHQGTIKAVPGEGPPDAKIMFIGEAPGFNEDRQGRPFVGAAGQFLNELLARAGLQRRDVFITNVVKHRPPNNRDPEPDEPGDREQPEQVRGGTQRWHDRQQPREAHDHAEPAQRPGQ